MAGVTHHGHGVYCTMCQVVHDSTDGCEHGLDDKYGVQKQFKDGYLASPEDMGHYSPHTFMDVDGMETCMECGAVKIPDGMVES